MKNDSARVRFLAFKSRTVDRLKISFEINLGCELFFCNFCQRFKSFFLFQKFFSKVISFKPRPLWGKPPPGGLNIDAGGIDGFSCDSKGNQSLNKLIICSLLFFLLYVLWYDGSSFCWLWESQTSGNALESSRVNFFLITLRFACSVVLSMGFGIILILAYHDPLPSHGDQFSTSPLWQSEQTEVTNDI